MTTATVVAGDDADYLTALAACHGLDIVLASR